jgi:L-ascorbate metabolism protein UlaG (beta-lactamase superfamily)
MEFQYFGGNCIRISSKKATVIVDDNLADLGQKSVTKAGDIALFTQAHGNPSAEVKISIDQPGEYEASDVSIQGIAARAHIDEPDKHTATMFKLTAEDIKIGILGHIYPELSDQQLEELGMIDVLLIPVGGNGYTLDGVGALKVIKKIEPKIVIPTHYDEKGLNFPVPQQPLSEALKSLAMEPKETLPKLKLKSIEPGDVAQLIILEKQ